MEQPSTLEWPWEVAERDHDIQNPTSPEKIRRLGELLRLTESSRVLDVACGKAAPSILLANEFGCDVVGVELRPAFAADARERVAAADLDGRVRVEIGDARTYMPERSVDVALCLGASFVWGHIGDAATVLRRFVRSRGHVVVGEPFWRSWPLPEDIEPQEWVNLTGTVDRFEAAGLHLVGVIASSESDWDRYESLHWRAMEAWLADQSEQPGIPELRSMHEQYKADYLRRRELLGWAMFVGQKAD